MKLRKTPHKIGFLELFPQSLCKIFTQKYLNISCYCWHTNCLNSCLARAWTYIHVTCQTPLEKIKLIIYDDIKTNGLTRIWKNAYAFIYMRLRSLRFLLPTQMFCLRNLQNSLTIFLFGFIHCLQSPYF